MAGRRREVVRRVALHMLAVVAEDSNRLAREEVLQHVACCLDADEGSASGCKLTLRRIIALLWLAVIIFVGHG